MVGRRAACAGRPPGATLRVFESCKKQTSPFSTLGSGASPTTVSTQELRGKHLTITGYHYPPALKYDASSQATGNAKWSGFDIKLLELVAGRLGFNYTIVHREGPKRNSSETWTQKLI